MLPDLTTAYVVLLASIGVGVGVLGTMVGVGGGFLLVPALLIIAPDADPAMITSISLTAVALNGLSATIGYRRRRQDLRTGVILVAFGVPAAVLGALVTRITERGTFEIVFGVMLVAGAIYLAWQGLHLAAAMAASGRGRSRRIVDRGGRVFAYRVNEPLAAGIAPVASFVAAFFGVGGGIIHVPVMILALRIPSAIAVATSQLELMVASAAAVAVHLAFSLGEGGPWLQALIVGGGSVAGAQIGVVLAGRVGGRFVLIVIAFGLFVAGVRQLVAGLA